MKKLNITKEHFEKSNYFNKKYGKLEYVSESGKLFKTDKGKILMFKEGVFGDIGDAIDSGVRGVRKFFHGKPKFKKGDIVMLCLADFSPSEVHHGEEIEDVKWNGRCWEYKMGNDPFGNAQWWPEDRVAEDPEPDKRSEPYVPEKFPEFKKFGKKFTKEASESEWLNTFKKAQDFVDKACEQLEIVAFEGGANVGNPIHKKLLRIWSEMRDVVAKTMDDESLVNESDDGSAWFDERGELLKPLPGACIMACAGQGRVDDDIDFWTRELGFDVGFPVEKAAKYLQEYGAWDDLDLLVDVANTGDKAKLTEWLKDNGNDEDIGRSTFDVKGFATRVLAHRVLWIFCNDLKELAYEMMDDETSLVSDWGDPSTWGDDEWERFQKEYSYCSLNN